MRFFLLVVVLCSSPLLHGCSPTFNWRDVRPDQTPLVALFPCKPDRSVRAVSLAAKDVTMTMLSCDAGGITFALAYADMIDAAMAGPVLAQWRSVTLGNLRAQSASERPFSLKGASVLPQSVQVKAQATRPDGTAVPVQGAWFAAGSVVFQATVYADAARQAEADAFLGGFRLQ